MIWPGPTFEELSEFYGSFDLDPDSGKPTDEWEMSHLVTIPIPFPMRLAWEPESLTGKIYCHLRIGSTLQKILQDIFDFYDHDIKALQNDGVDLYGGCYNFRSVRGGRSLSLHAWGAAVDLSPDANPLGKAWEPDAGMIPMDVVRIFKNHGVAWGGDFSRPDPMHFEFVTRN